MTIVDEFVPSAEQSVGHGECWFIECDRSDTRLYIIGPACDQHAPWAITGRKDPRTQIDQTRTEPAMRIAPTPLYAKGGTDIDKLKPGGYVSRQRAVKIAAERDAARARNTS